MDTRQAGWKTKLLFFRLRYSIFGLQNRQRPGRFSYSTSRQFGLAYENGQRNIARALLKELQRDDKQVSTLALGREGSRTKEPQLRTNKMSLLGTPLSEEISRFLARDYDAVINLVPDAVPQVEYVFRKARTLNRSGLYLASREEHYDLLVKGNRKETRSHAELLLHLLKKTG